MWKIHLIQTINCLLIKRKCRKWKLKYPKTFIGYSQTTDDAYKIYSIVDMESNKK